jgi:hypothetical protein
MSRIRILVALIPETNTVAAHTQSLASDFED